MMGIGRGMKSSLVSVGWLRKLIHQSKTDKHRILDASWHLPNSGRNAAEEFTKKHIPGALFFDIDDCAEKSTDLPHMIPSVEVFEKYAGNLGISNNTHVIVYDNNDQFPIFSAQRVWWLFRLFGHNKVSVLDGGLPKWVLEGGNVTPEVINFPKEKFIAAFQSHLVKSFIDIENNIKSSDFVTVDARPEGRFHGTMPEPRSDVKPGCIPNSLNIPFMTLLNIEDRTVKSPEELKDLFAAAGMDLSQPITATCGSGISACILALAAYECGKEDVAVYDGSWTEYYHRAPAHLKNNVPKD